MVNVEIRIVDDELCPTCGRGAPDFPNRPKVCDGSERWWWRCYNPDCDTAMYLPETGETERELTAEEKEEQAKRIAAFVDNLVFLPPVEIAPGVTEIRTMTKEAYDGRS